MLDKLDAHPRTGWRLIWWRAVSAACSALLNVKIGPSHWWSALEIRFPRTRPMIDELWWWRALARMRAGQLVIVVDDTIDAITLE